MHKEVVKVNASHARLSNDGEQVVVQHIRHPASARPYIMLTTDLIARQLAATQQTWLQQVWHGNAYIDGRQRVNIMLGTSNRKELDTDSRSTGLKDQSRLTRSTYRPTYSQDFSQRKARQAKNPNRTQWLPHHITFP